eukprot:3442376-Pleurochrysis_carterae.AAC.1
MPSAHSVGACITSQNRASCTSSTQSRTRCSRHPRVARLVARSSDEAVLLAQSAPYARCVADITHCNRLLWVQLLINSHYRRPYSVHQSAEIIYSKSRRLVPYQPIPAQGCRL